MAKPTAEQIEFARKRGITLCPPSPAFTVAWGGRSHRRRISEPSEEEQLTVLRGSGSYYSGSRFQPHGGKSHG